MRAHDEEEMSRLALDMTDKRLGMANIWQEGGTTPSVTRDARATHPSRGGQGGEAGCPPRGGQGVEAACPHRISAFSKGVGKV